MKEKNRNSDENRDGRSFFGVLEEKRRRWCGKGRAYSMLLGETITGSCLNLINEYQSIRQGCRIVFSIRYFLTINLEYFKVCI
jgi:hypothetical protein